MTDLILVHHRFLQDLSCGQSSVVMGSLYF